jgi:hypothetical protein
MQEVGESGVYWENWVTWEKAMNFQTSLVKKTIVNCEL